MEIQNFLCQIFGEDYESDVKKAPLLSSYSDQLLELERWVNDYLKRKADYVKEEQEKDDRDGRIGFRKVRLRIKTQHGTVTMNDARTAIIGQSNIATVCGDCVVCRGKWMYEVQLKSRGSMRLGWLKHGQKCTRDKGVGDLYGSYGYDGNQKRLITSGSIRVYGEAWHTGDIVGVLINFEKQVVEYYLNGRSFGQVCIDPVQFLYPAVTVTKFESIYVNFGREKFCYSVSGYEPLERITQKRINQAKYFIYWIEATLQAMSTMDLKTILDENISIGALINEILKIFEIFFTDLIDDSYIIANDIIPFMFRLAVTEQSTSKLMFFLNFLWDFLHTEALISILKQIFERLKLTFRQAAINLQYSDQKDSLTLIRELLKHRPTRLFAIRYVYFDKCGFGFLFHVKPLDDYFMEREVSDVWWENKDLWMEKKRKTYEINGKRMLDSLTELEKIQDQIISLFMINTDGNEFETSTRTLFLSELRDFAVIQKFSVHLGLNMDMPPPVALTTFFKLLIIFDNLTYGSPITDIVPQHVFYDGSILYEFCDRLGGLEDYLKTTLRTEIVAALKGEPRQRKKSSLLSDRFENTSKSSGVVLIMEPVTSVKMGPKLSFQLEKEREKYFGLDTKNVKSDNNNVENKHIKTAPFSSNLPQPISEESRGSASERIGLMVVQENLPQSTSDAQNILNVVLQRQQLSQSVIRDSLTSITSGRTSASRFVSQLPIAESITSTAAISMLSTRSEQHGNVSTAVNPPSISLTPIVENDNIEPMRDGSDTSGRTLSSSHLQSFSSSPFMNTAAIVIDRSHNSQDLGNEFVVIALKEMLPIRTIPEVNLMDEIVRIPNNREDGIINEKTSYIELLDMILFIFIILAKRQIQKIAEIYLRFANHERSWHNLKIQEKLFNKSILSKAEICAFQFDPFDIYYFDEQTVPNNSPTPSQISIKAKQKKFKSVQGERAMVRYKTETKYGPYITSEVLRHAIVGHEKILNELSRDKLWVRNVVLTSDRVTKLFHLLERLCDIIFNEIHKEQLFSFVPDFYVLVIESLVTALYIHLPAIYDLEKEFHQVSANTLKNVTNLTVELIGDHRLIKDDCRDAVERVLATLVHTKYTLKAVEKLSSNLQEKVMLYLIRSYNVKRNVAANWILVRMWSGNGFAFQYNRIPNTKPTINKWMYINISYSLCNMDPNPSSILQQTFLRTLQNHNADTLVFFNNILNNMNWACSEFLSMLQEVKQVAVVKEPIIIEPHTMHLISACFDFAVGMIRVIEMTLTLTQGIIVPNDVYNNDILITRLLQTICLTIARLTDEKGCFRVFLDMEFASAETIQSFPIVTALYGVLLTLFKREIQDSKATSQEPTKLIKILYKECRDHVDALENVITSQSDFRLVNNPIYTNDITLSEQKQLVQFIKIIQRHKKALIAALDATSNEDELLCTICYSNPKDVYFEPCHHESCLSCVKQQLLETRNCFFCKIPILEIRKCGTDEMLMDLSDTVGTST